jgi:phosphate acetyltransferase
MEMLKRKVDKVVFFRPIISAAEENAQGDNDIKLIASYFNLGIPYEKMYGLTSSEVSDLLSLGKEGDIFDTIFGKFDNLKASHDFVLCEGTDLASSAATFEFDINAEISKNLGCPVLLVANAYQQETEDVLRSTELALDSLKEKGCRTTATIVNRIKPEDRAEIVRLLKANKWAKDQLVYVIPDEESLGKPTVGEVAEILGAEVLYGQEQLNRHVYNFTVAAMQLRNLLPRIERGSLIITPGDRADVIVACLATVSSASMENISGVPILSVPRNTFPTATVVEKIHATISPDDERKITQALAVFEKNVDIEQLGEKIITTQTTIRTPKMFEYELVQKARAHKKHVVLPEGEEERVLQAAEILHRRDVVDMTLLGCKETIEGLISDLGLRFEGVHIVEPRDSELFDEYTQTYFDLRKHKGITMENARDIMRDVNFFGTMMVYKGHADGMVSGAVHSTAATIRPSFEIVKTKPGFSIVSSVFFMCLPDKVLVYGDCAVNPNPDAKQLAEIALSSAQTAKTFEIDPLVAMLSYSTGESGKGAEVEKVREAARMAKEMAPEVYPGLRIEGPIQYDAAVDPGVAKTKLPDSKVAGQATVFIFPDLNTGNNTYKAVQRSAGAVAIGPVLQGLKRPVNDLSRGCTIPDIVNTVAITAIQAQTEGNA